MFKQLFVLFAFAIAVHTTSAQEKKPLLSSFIPKGFTLLDSVSGDLNKDGLRDYALILKNNLEKDNPDTTRPLLILLQTKKQGFTLHARNDNVVMCKSCGGVFGDPFDGIYIKKGILIIHHYGGSNWRWAREIQFKYYTSDKSFKLYKDLDISYHTGNLEKIVTQFIRKMDFGKLPFTKFDYNSY